MQNLENENESLKNQIKLIEQKIKSWANVDSLVIEKQSPAKIMSWEVKKAEHYISNNEYEQCKTIFH